MLLALHAATACVMAAVLWYVQLAHYPRFAKVPLAEFPAYQARNIRRTACLVGPVMALEGAGALALALRVGGTTAWAGLAILAILWGSTFLIQLPLHRALREGFDPTIHERLLGTNRLRVVGWTARAGLALWMLLPR